jgi:transposase
METTVLGIDLAKNVFQLHGVDVKGRVVLKRRVRRAELGPVVEALSPCVIGLEACASAFYWAREFQRAGHTVRIISPQFVKPFIRGNKNDGNDAAAICEAVQRPAMRFVPLKSVEQQDVQSLHRARQRLVNHRTALISQMRGILLDRGIVFGKSASRARRLLPLIVADPAADLSDLIREILSSLLALLHELDARVKAFDRQIAKVFKESAVCQRIACIESVGPKTAPVPPRTRVGRLSYRRPLPTPLVRGTVGAQSPPRRPADRPETPVREPPLARRASSGRHLGAVGVALKQPDVHERRRHPK